jgi:hypothetical protein
MRDKNLETASSYLRANSTVLRPEIEALRRVLHDELVITGNTLPHLELNARLEQNNVAMFSEITQLLPAASLDGPQRKDYPRYDGFFLLDDELKVEPLINHAVWLNFEGTYKNNTDYKDARTKSTFYSSRPFYVLGDNHAKKEKRRLLLASPRIQEPNNLPLLNGEETEGFFQKTAPGAIFKFAPNSRLKMGDYDKARTGFKKALAPGVIASFYDREARKLRLWPLHGLATIFTANPDTVLRMDSLSTTDIDKYHILDSLGLLGPNFDIHDQIDKVLKKYQLKARQAQLEILGQSDAGGS